MKVIFNTKEESNRRREEDFLALAPSERVFEFLRFSQQILNEYPSSLPRDYGSNLVLELSPKIASTNDGME